MNEGNKTKLTKDEREWLAMLRKRHAHLRDRILDQRELRSGRATSFDAKEAQAIEWAIREVGKARIIEEQPVEHVELRGPEIIHRRKTP